MPSIAPDKPISDSTLALAAYHIKSIWLFTFSDLKTIIGPSTLFGVVHALSATVFGIEPVSHSVTPVLMLRITARAAFWAWINLLPFAIDNQRQMSSIAEDALNKPWRSMPSKRLTIAQATRLMWCLYPAAFVASLVLGGWRQSVSLMALGFWYNDLQGADSNCWIRNLINGAGFLCFLSGAFEVALGRRLALTGARLLPWLLINGAVVFSTVHSQDMADQPGDALRGRRTVPLTIGDAPARWIIALLMPVWACFCPWFWALPAVAYAPSVALGCVVAGRTLALRGVGADKRTFRLWNLWMVVLYLTPLVKHLTAAPG